MKGLRARCGLATALLLAARVAAAHDFWIEPSTFRPAPGEDFTVALRVGEHFRGEPVPRDERRIKRFFLVSNRGESPIPGLPGSDPAGFAKADDAGVIAIGYRSDRSPVMLEAAKFEKYLTDEGLETVIAERGRRKESDKPGREVFSRSVKSIVVAGPRGRDFDRRLGLDFEILVETDPAAWRPDPKSPMRFQVLSDGKPFGGALVKAICRDDPDRTLTARSGRRGEVSIVLPRKGVWLVEAVRMARAPKDLDADWESVWTSVTFEIP
ncbi:MAG TPA: DUF4198 domain-containing protein [Thermoanaerobaculia bacterium]|nr:DUF4198 domain-containing protein [Thermoanaerobaculia bacterium]